MGKIIFKFSFFILVSISMAHGFGKKVDQVDPKDKKILDQVKVEKGGLILVEQHLVAKNNYNKKDKFKLEFLCEKKSPSKTPECHVVEYEVYDTPKLR